MKNTKCKRCTVWCLPTGRYTYFRLSFNSQGTLRVGKYKVDKKDPGTHHLIGAWRPAERIMPREVK